MLVVMGIIAALVTASLAGYRHVLKTGEQARAHELVSNVATALAALFEREGVWPKEIRQRNASGDKLDAKVAWYLRKDFGLKVASDADEDTTEVSKRQTIGLDRFGIITPWATASLKRRKPEDLKKSADALSVPGGGTVDDHTVRFAVDLNGDGLIENVSIGGVGRNAKSSMISVRATAIAWCCDREGKIVDYATGVRKGGIYSWSHGQTKNAK